MMKNAMTDQETCFVNFTHECFYRIFPLENRVEFIISTEDEEEFMGSFISSDAFIQFLRDRLYPLKEAVFNKIYQEVSQKVIVPSKSLDRLYQYRKN